MLCSRGGLLARRAPARQACATRTPCRCRCAPGRGVRRPRRGWFQSPGPVPGPSAPSSPCHRVGGARAPEGGASPPCASIGAGTNPSPYPRSAPASPSAYKN